jgi:hypothetical protein
MPRNRDQEAGALYEGGALAVRNGGHELTMLAAHLTHMVRGTVDHVGPLWPVRVMRDGQEYRLERFLDYLREPPRHGLGLPSLHFLRQVLVASIEYGDIALALVRTELAKESVDFDAVADREEQGLAGQHARKHPVRGSAGAPSKVDNVAIGYISRNPNSKKRILARLARDHPKILAAYERGEFKSARAAGIAAGIITPQTALAQIKKLLPKLTVEERRQLLLDLQAMFAA